MAAVNLARELSTGGVHYRFTREDGSALTDVFPLDEDGGVEAGPRVRALETLWYDDGLEERADSYLLPVSEIFELEPALRQELELPRDTIRVNVELRTSGYAGADGFQVKPVVRVESMGIVPSEQRTGPFLRLGNELKLVEPDAAALLAEVDADPGEAVEDHLLYIGRIRKLAEAAEADLDDYLSGQVIEVPEGIGVEAEAVAPDEIRLRPVPIGSDFELGSGRTSGSYFKTDGGKRRRLVLTDDDVESADAVKRQNRIQGKDVPRFLDNPEAFLPDEIDLDLFSLRVKGVVPRRYNSQPYLELDKSTSRDWFDASVEIETMEGSLPEAPAEDGDAGSAWGTGGESRSEPPGDEALSTPNVDPDVYARLCEEVVESGDRYVMHEGDWIEIDPERAKAYLEAWEHLEPGENGKYRLPRSDTGYVLDVISNVDELEYFEDEPSLPDPLEGVPEYPTPEPFVKTLRPYQELGFSWLRFLYEQGYGGLLADDMGLGKTVQVIALMAHLVENDELAPALLVVPAAVMQNWREEIEKFCPSIRQIYQHRGPGRIKNPAKLEMWEVVLTTYATLRRDQLALGQVDWSLVACDEAQKVKNPTAQRTSAVKAMKSSLRLALTGTPVENGLSELWCIVDFAQPGKLGSRKEFKEEFERPIQEGAATRASRQDLATRLQERLTPHYLRRVKEDVLDELPERMPDQRIEVPLSANQKRYYARVRRAKMAGDTIALAALQNLLQICSHPDLYTEQMRPPGELIDRCPKLEATLGLIDDIRSQEEGVLLYTRYRHMQRILQETLRHRFGIHAPILNGEVRTGQRHAQVNRFNEDTGFRAMILSPEAAGVGLNITGANHVIHYTRLWNPAKENQATDRVYRIGQERTVQVYYPIVEGDGFKTIEEHLDELLTEKQQLARDVVWPRDDLSVVGDMQKRFAGEAHG